MMKTQRPLAALTRLPVIMLVMALSMLTARVHAQDADLDPPGRVARVSDLSGQVWLYSPDAGEWVAASRNRPMTTGDRVATEAGARAELQIGSTTVRIDASTELEVVRLDDDHLVLDLHDGSAIAQVRDLNGAGEFELLTEEGRFVVLGTGLYRFDRDNARSDVTVFSGQARYEGPNSGLAVYAGQRAEFWIDSGGVAQYSTLLPANDAFVAWSNERDRRLVGNIAQRYVSPEMTGAAELDAYGRWEQTPDYGSVWIPTAVAADWAPYSQGHWAFVRPWGWTWVDDAPWGFAPFHYGRWVYLRNNWCWTPGTRVARPVYAPALVAWVGGPRGNVSVNIGGGPAVGWFPLAPREVYVPSYRVSPRYARNVNITNVTNVTVINNVFANPQGPREFENRHFPRAITVVPSNVIAERRPVGPAAAQYRQTPWVREFANQPGRTAAMLAPQVATPSMPARIGNNEPRAVRPPPGLRPDAGDRPGFAGRPGFSPRDRGDRNEADRARERDVRPPAQQAVPGQAREMDRGGPTAGQRPPGAFSPQQPNPLPSQTAPQGAQAPVAPPSNLNRPASPFDRDMRRPEERGPGSTSREREGNASVPRPPGMQPPRSAVQPMQPVVPPQQSAVQPMQPVAPPQQSAVQPPRPTAAPAAPQEAPMMRPLPLQRGDERRFEDRRQAPRPEPMPPQIEQRPAQPPHMERPAPPPPMAQPQPQPQPMRPAEPPRPAAPAVVPTAPAPRMDAPRPQQPEQRSDGPRRGDQRDQR